ncbi:MAG: hypothetical protein WBQ73_01585 [Candidatus Babeliales bacterium]
MTKGLVFTLLICLSLSQAHGAYSNEPKTYTSYLLLQYVPPIVTGYAILCLTRSLRQPTRTLAPLDPPSTSRDTILENKKNQVIIFGINHPLCNSVNSNS